MCVCVSVMSVSIDEEGSHSSSSEEEADSHSPSSPRAMPSSPSSSSSHPSTSASTPPDMPCPYPSSSLYSPCSYLSSSPTSSVLSSPCPGSLELVSPCSSHDPDSACGSGHASPLLGPRSQCSGASSPDCDQERGVCSSHQCVYMCVDLWFDCSSSVRILCNVTLKEQFNVFGNTLVLFPTELESSSG